MQLPPKFDHTPSVVMEAAMFLLQQGLLNIPDVGIVNVKQARAFLWNAAWLQEHMNTCWQKDGSFLCDSAVDRHFKDFALIKGAIWRKLCGEHSRGSN